jgi:hypothetical protein
MSVPMAEWDRRETVGARVMDVRTLCREAVECIDADAIVSGLLAGWRNGWARFAMRRT